MYKDSKENVCVCVCIYIYTDCVYTIMHGECFDEMYGLGNFQLGNYQAGDLA